MKLPQCSASPARSTPGPLPYHMPNTPSTRLPGNASSCCVPYSMVAARSSLTPGWKRMLCAASSFWRRQSFAVQPAQRRAAIAGDQSAGVRPGQRSSRACSSSTRTSAWMPDSRIGGVEIGEAAFQRGGRVAETDVHLCRLSACTRDAACLKNGCAEAILPCEARARTRSWQNSGEAAPKVVSTIVCCRAAEGRA